MFVALLRRRFPIATAEDSAGDGEASAENDPGSPPDVRQLLSSHQMNSGAASLVLSR